jgi:hypothetical protein
MVSQRRRRQCQLSSPREPKISCAQRWTVRRSASGTHRAGGWWAPQQIWIRWRRKESLLLMGSSPGRPASHFTYQCSKWTGICLYTIPELPFVPEFHTGTYQYVSPLSSSILQTVHPCFAFKKYTGTSTVPFRALSITQ